MINLLHSGPTILAAFLASLVEFVEALTIVFAVAVSCNWRSSLIGAGGGVIVLAGLVAVFGPFLTQDWFPLSWLQLFIGIFLLLFGSRWLRKAVLRAAGIIPFHDEAKIYNEQKALLDGQKQLKSFDSIGGLASFKAVLIEGIEVVFIIIAVGAAQASFILPALGAASALLFVILLGLMLRGPLTRVPENSLKFSVGVILTAFGAFWIGEGSGLGWPDGDLAIIVLIIVVLGVAFLNICWLRRKTPGRTYD